MINKISRNKSREIRQKRIRKTLFGTADRPRLSIFKSNKNIYVQLIDDENHKTIISASTKEATSGKNIESAKSLGELIAEKAKTSKIKKIVFDRSGYKYHGKIKALADGAREKGLEF